MAREKAIRARLLSVKTQPTATTAAGIKIGGTSLAGTATEGVNPLRSRRFWDSVEYVLGVTVAGGATGGSWTLNLRANPFPTGSVSVGNINNFQNIYGVSGALGISNVLIGGVSLGPNTTKIRIPHACGTPGTPTPVTVELIRHAAGNLDFDLDCVAKTSISDVSAGPNPGHDRMVMGQIAHYQWDDDTLAGTSDLHNAFVVSAADGGKPRFAGLNKQTLWDQVNFFYQGETWAGAVTVHVLGTIGGKTYALASSAANAAAGSWPLVNQTDGPMPVPDALQLVVASDGVSDMRIGYIAKTSAGR